MNNWTDWAWMQALPTPEKLVLVYLAERVNTAGIGLWDRAELEAQTGYKPRSVQRLLKVLRDEKRVEDRGPWYQLGNAWQPDGPLPDPQETAAVRHGRPMTLQAIADAEGGGELRAPIDEAEIGEAIAARITDAADYLGEQLATVLHKFSGEIDRLAMLHMEQREFLERPPADPPPAPLDPVKENPLYRQLLDQGLPEEWAYRLSREHLELAAAVDDRGKGKGEIAHQAQPAPAGDAQAPGAQPYADTPAGRCERVKDALTGPDNRRPPTAEELDAWQYLEQLENRFTVTGEVDGFLLVYPAIVAAAQREAGRMTLLEFIEPTAVDAGQAPWDQDPDPTPDADEHLEREVARMRAELEQANDPRCQVQGRTIERKDDGSTVQETMLGYYRRVLAKYREMQKLREMGVLGG